MRHSDSRQSFLSTMSLLVILMFTLVGCDSSSNSDDAATATSPGGSTNQNYYGPGSKWDVNLADDNTFAITRRDDVSSPVTLTVTGTYQRLASGFLKLTVTNSDGTDGPVPGDQAWALEVPGYAFLLRPIDPGSEQLIPMVTSGSCPTSDIHANWVLVKKANSADATDPTRDFFGTFQFNVTTGAAELPSRYALGGDFAALGDDDLSTGTCANGIMEVADGVMYLTANGGAIVHINVLNPSEASFIFGLSQKAITNVTNLDGEYAGVLFDESLASGDKIAPVSLSCANGTCTGVEVTDIDTGATSTESVTITLVGAPDALGLGLVTGTITNNGTGNLACLADFDVLSSGRQMMSCVGQSPGDPTKMFNVLLVSKDLAT